MSIACLTSTLPSSRMIAESPQLSMSPQLTFRGVKHLAPAPAQFRAAHSLSEVIDAWRLCYRVYVQSGFIPHNPWRLHCTLPALSRQTAVFFSAAEGCLECTLSAMIDGPDGLQLDTVYPDLLNQMRSQGRRLLEAGLFAHARQLDGDQPWGSRINGREEDADHVKQAAHGSMSLLGLMRLCFYYGIYSDVTDFVVGCHPRHGRFYQRFFGFNAISEVKSYSTVNDRPVVLMHVDVAEALRRRPTPAGLEYCLANPMDAEAFANRFRFNRDLIAASNNDLRGYIADRWPERTIDTDLRVAM